MEFISNEKKLALEKELVYLKTDRRKELAENLARARGLGDLSENAEYHSAREEQGFAEDRVRQIEHVLKNAKIVTGTKTTGVIQMGSIVEIKKKGEKISKKIEIVGGEESDMMAGKVSYKSPLGSILVGEKEGENVCVITPKGEIIYKIVSIS